jgi:hypothetical protein
MAEDHGIAADDGEVEESERVAGDASEGDVTDDGGGPATEDTVTPNAAGMADVVADAPIVGEPSTEDTQATGVADLGAAEERTAMVDESHSENTPPLPADVGVETESHELLSGREKPAPLPVEEVSDTAVQVHAPPVAAAKNGKPKARRRTQADLDVWAAAYARCIPPGTRACRHVEGITRKDLNHRAGVGAAEGRRLEEIAGWNHWLSDNGMEGAELRLYRTFTIPRGPNMAELRKTRDGG